MMYIVSWRKTHNTTIHQELHQEGCTLNNNLITLDQTIPQVCILEQNVGSGTNPSHQDSNIRKEDNSSSNDRFYDAVQQLSESSSNSPRNAIYHSNKGTVLDPDEACSQSTSTSKLSQLSKSHTRWKRRKQRCKEKRRLEHSLTYQKVNHPLLASPDVPKRRSTNAKFARKLCILLEIAPTQERHKGLHSY